MSKIFIDTNILVHGFDGADSRDALIVAAAEASKRETIWSEDFQAGRVLRGMRIENPLRA